MGIAKLAMCVLVGLLFLIQNDCDTTLKGLDYDVTSVSLEGPSSIKNGTSANYTVTFTVQHQRAPYRDAVPQLKDQDSWFRDGDDLLSWTTTPVVAGTNTYTTTLSLSCVNDEVRGTATTAPNGTANDPGSGEGGKFLWWDDPAEIYAHVRERDSSIIEVSCTP